MSDGISPVPFGDSFGDSFGGTKFSVAGLMVANFGVNATESMALGN